MRFEDKVVIVTGGSRGLGRAMVLAFAQEGASVVVAATNLARVRAIVDEIEALGGQGFCLCTDVSHKDAVQKMVDTVLRRFGQIDILVNNAGIHVNAPFVEEPEDMWLRLFQVNVMGVVFPSQAVAPHMMERKRGRIINISSKAAVVGESGHVAYSASKGAVLSMTRAMAVDLAPYNITVNAVCPGPVYTDMLLAAVPEEAGREALAADTPLGRLGQPEDIAAAVLYLASDEAGWCTGQALSIDGGLSILK